MGYSVLLGDIKQHIKIKPIDEGIVVSNFRGHDNITFLWENRIIIYG